MCLVEKKTATNKNSIKLHPTSLRSPSTFKTTQQPGRHLLVDLFIDEQCYGKTGGHYITNPNTAQSYHTHLHRLIPSVWVFYDPCKTKRPSYQEQQPQLPRDEVFNGISDAYHHLTVVSLRNAPLWQEASLIAALQEFHAKPAVAKSKVISYESHDVYIYILCEGMLAVGRGCVLSQTDKMLILE